MPLWISDGIGMMGTAMVVLAFYLLQLERADPKGLTYNLINLFGACCLLLSLSFTFNLPSFLINVFWVGASLIGLWKFWRQRTAAST